jgi:hypothetical protein
MKAILSKLVQLLQKLRPLTGSSIKKNSRPAAKCTLRTGS